MGKSTSSPGIIGPESPHMKVIMLEYLTNKAGTGLGFSGSGNQIRARILIGQLINTAKACQAFLILSFLAGSVIAKSNKPD